MEPVKKFKFLCHKDLPCFNECCKNLTLPLTPYDVFRLRQSLGLSSSEFLQRYTTWHVGYATGLPVVVLKSDSGKCPFVSNEGCRVYPNRPSACRLYPLVRVKVGDEEYYYLLKEEFCLGFNETKEWSVEEWIDDQGARIYNEMNDIFAELIAAARGKSLSLEDIKKIYTACFDIDRFDSDLSGEELLRESLKWAISYVQSL